MKIRFLPLRLTAVLSDTVTSRLGFLAYLTSVMAGFWLLRVTFPKGPSNADVFEQFWMMVSWKWSYGSGANPPLFTWLVKIVDTVIGMPALSVETVRFAFLWLLCFLSAQCFRTMTGDGRLAALAGFAPLSVYAIGWEALFRHSNTLMLMVSIPLTFIAIVRLGNNRNWGAYLFFGLVTAFGFYSKYNYAIVWCGIMVAALFDRDLRGSLLHPRMIGALMLTLLLMSPLLHWISNNLPGILSHGQNHLQRPPNHPSLPGPLSALVDMVVHALGMLVPLYIFLLIICPSAFSRSARAGATLRWQRLHERYLLFVFGALVTTVFLLGAGEFPLRYIYVLLPVIPLAFLRLAGAGVGSHAFRGLTTIIAGLIVLIMVGTAYRGVTYSSKKRHQHRVLFIKDSSIQFRSQLLRTKHEPTDRHPASKSSHSKKISWNFRSSNRLAHI